MSNSAERKIPLKMHPWEAALGADLVMNDIVAIIELVKNSYDAFASEVKVILDRTEGSLFPYIEVTDNGLGMTSNVIDDVWCNVVPLYKETHPILRSWNKLRQVSGAKRLGRLAVCTI